MIVVMIGKINPFLSKFMWELWLCTNALYLLLEKKYLWKCKRNVIIFKVVLPFYSMFCLSYFRVQTTPISMVHPQKTRLYFFHLELQMMQTSKKDFCGSKKTKFSLDGKKDSLSLQRTTSIVSKKEILD